MKISWHFTAADVDRVRALLHEQRNNAIVAKRRRLNLSSERPPVTRDSFWFQMVNGQLTSVQRSGPESPVGRLMRTTPFPLSYSVLSSRRDVEKYSNRVLREHGGVRFHNNIASRLSTNLDKLETGKWDEALAQCARLQKLTDYQTEAEVAQYFDDGFVGLGPKQARNVLQGLGLTRFETPLDSRVTDWLNRAGFPIELKARSLSDIGYYSFVSEGFRELCSKAGVFPCELDAAIFALPDGDAWTDENAVY